MFLHRRDHRLVNWTSALSLWLLLAHPKLESVKSKSIETSILGSPQSMAPHPMDCKHPILGPMAVYTPTAVQQEFPTTPRWRYFPPIPMEVIPELLSQTASLFKDNHTRRESAESADSLLFVSLPSLTLRRSARKFFWKILYISLRIGLSRFSDPVPLRKILMMECSIKMIPL